MSGQPDPKNGPRIVDPEALRRARARGDCCAGCGGPPSNVHHILQRGSPHFGDDVEANFLLVCGSGTMGCHGAWHGSPYTAYVQLIIEGGREARPERRDKPWVALRIGRFMLRERPDTILYVIAKLGWDPALAFLEREYRIEPVESQRVWRQTREHDLGLAR